MVEICSRQLKWQSFPHWMEWQKNIIFLAWGVLSFLCETLKAVNPSLLPWPVRPQDTTAVNSLVHQLFVVFKKVSWNFWLHRSPRLKGPFIKPLKWTSLMNLFNEPLKAVNPSLLPWPVRPQDTTAVNWKSVWNLGCIPYQPYSSSSTFSLIFCATLGWLTYWENVTSILLTSSSLVKFLDRLIYIYLFWIDFFFFRTSSTRITYSSTQKWKGFLSSEFHIPQR